MHLVHPVQDGVQGRTLVNTILNYRVPESTGNFLGMYATNSLSKEALLHVVIQSQKGGLH